MGRLTTDKPIEEMNMTELALNCCYVKDGKARYRDYDTNIDARAFVRNLLAEYEIVEKGDTILTDDNAFDEFMMEVSMYDPGKIEGLIALFYRNLWAMAELRERLKEYEDSESKIDNSKHGFWTDTGYENSTGSILLCTNCGCTYNPNNQDIKLGRAEERPDYCPNCGSKMDLEDK